MPYSPDDVEKLPANVQKMSDKDRSQWCAVWNSVYEKTSSEESAFKQANGVLKKGISLDDFDEIELADDLQDIQQIITKEFAIPVEIIPKPEKFQSEA